jgi:hypothetical protein
LRNGVKAKSWFLEQYWRRKFVKSAFGVLKRAGVPEMRLILLVTRFANSEKNTKKRETNEPEAEN